MLTWLLFIIVTDSGSISGPTRPNASIPTCSAWLRGGAGRWGPSPGTVPASQPSAPITASALESEWRGATLGPAAGQSWQTISRWTARTSSLRFARERVRGGNWNIMQILKENHIYCMLCNWGYFLCKTFNHSSFLLQFAVSSRQPCVKVMLWPLLVPSDLASMSLLPFMAELATLNAKMADTIPIVLRWTLHLRAPWILRISSAKSKKISMKVDEPSTYILWVRVFDGSF